MKLGVVLDGQANFIEEMLTDWRSQYEMSLFSFQELNLPFAKGRINPLRHRSALRSFMQRQDVVFFEWVGSNLVLASQLNTGKPIVARLHSWELFHDAKRVNWDAITKVILVSQAMCSKFIERYPGQAAKTVVLPAGKSLTRFAPVEHPFEGNLALLGSLFPIKRVYEMVLVIAELRKLGYPFTLHLGGMPGTDFANERYYASVLSLVKKLKLEDQVIFHGWVGSPETWLQKVDVLISNSYWEGQQNSLIEGMATGCYCLCHFWDGAEEILPEAYLYTSEAELVQKIIDYYHLPDEQKRVHQQRLRAIAIEKYDIVRTGAMYRQVIEDASFVSLKSGDGSKK